jgi:ribosomal 30S subunit maturation factor RimM
MEAFPIISCVHKLFFNNATYKMEVLKMEPKQPGNEKLPDFKEMTDRVIAEPAKGPQLVIKTNLDPSDATEENPYYQNDQIADSEQFKEYFKE